MLKIVITILLAVAVTGRAPPKFEKYNDVEFTFFNALTHASTDFKASGCYVSKFAVRCDIGEDFNKVKQELEDWEMLIIGEENVFLLIPKISEECIKREESKILFRYSKKNKRVTIKAPAGSLVNFPKVIDCPAESLRRRKRN